MRVLFCGGGTAGHVNPAIAVAQTVMEKSRDNRVAYIVTTNGIENQLVDFKKYQIDVVGFKGRLSFKNISAIFKQIKGIEKCQEYIREFRPDVIFGTGGYATYPAITAGKKLGVKTVIHESNVIPGKAIKALERKADKILVNFDESQEYFNCKDKIIRTGNPVRSGCIQYTKEQAKRELSVKEKYVILCTGGSLGARRINDSAIEMIDNYVRHKKDVFLFLSTGKKDYEYVLNTLEKRGISNLKNIMVKEYIEDMPRVMAAADIVISRAGAMTISELACMNKASILIPSPNVANNHQYANALSLKNSDSAILITEDRTYKIVDTVRDLIQNSEERIRLSKNIGNYALMNANEKIYDIFKELIKK